MKTPRVKGFDPDAKVPELKSSLADMPSISKPRFRIKQEGQSNPKSTLGNIKLAEKSHEVKNEEKQSILYGTYLSYDPYYPYPLTG